MLTEIAKRAIDLAVTAPSADNSQPWQFSRQGDRWDVSYSHQGTKDLFGPTGHATLLSTGALNHNLDQICGQMNTRSSVDSEGNWKLSFLLPERISETVEVTLRQRHTNRHPFTGEIKAPPPALSSELDQIKLQFVSERAAIRQIAKAVKICSEIRFHNKALHEWLFSSLRWTPGEVAKGDGLDLRTLHLPPGGVLFMRFISSWQRLQLLNSIGFSKLMALIDSQPVREAPALLVISSKQDPQLTWQAGKMLAEAWTKLNHIGVAVHPYYVITDISNRLQNNKLDDADIPAAKAALLMTRQALKLEDDELPHIVLRIGYPTVTPELSKRKPPESFIQG